MPQDNATIQPTDRDRRAGVLWLPVIFVAALIFIALLIVLPLWAATALLRMSFVAAVVALLAYVYATNPRFASSRRTLLTRIDNLSERLRPFSRWFAFSAVVLLILSAVDLISTPVVTFPHVVVPQTALSLALIGGLALGMAILTARGTPALPDLLIPADHATQPARVAWLPLIFGGLMLAVLGETSARLFDLELLRQVPTGIQAILLYGGVILIAWGLGGAPVPRVRLRRESVAVLALVILALGIRLWHIDSALPVLIDEMNFVDATRGTSDNAYVPLLQPISGFLPFTSVYPLWESNAATLFGRSLIALRAPSAILGALTVAALYLLASALFDRKTALIAATLLVTFPPFLHFSRMALNQSGDALFGTLALAFTARGLKYNRSIDWAIAGVSLGLTQYFYEAGRIFFPALVLAWIVWLAITAPGHLRDQRRGVLRLLAGALLVSAPFLYTLAAQDRPLFGRMGDSGLSASFWQHMLDGSISEGEYFEHVDRLERPFLFYLYLPEEGAITYYGGGEPLVIRAFVPLLLLGAFYLLWRPRQAGFVILLAVIAAALSIALFIVETTLSTRFVIVMPELVLLMAVGLRCVPPLIWQPPENAHNWRVTAWHYALPIGIVSVLTVTQVQFYFGAQMADLNRRARQALTYDDVWDAILRAAKLPYDTQTIMVGDPTLNPIQPGSFLGYLQAGNKYPVETYTPQTFFMDDLIQLPRNRNYAFFVRPEYNTTLAKIYAAFPDADPPTYTRTDLAPDAEYILIFVPQTLN